MPRAGYVYEKGIFNQEERFTAFTGPSAGATIEFPFGEAGTLIGVDYAFRATNPFTGAHTIGVHVDIK